MKAAGISFSRLLLVLVFVASQWLAVVHAAHHELIEHGGGNCHVCAIAHAAPVPPSIAAAPVRPVPGVALRVAPIIGLIDQRPFARIHNRGPPSFLA